MKRSPWLILMLFAGASTAFTITLSARRLAAARSDQQATYAALLKTARDAQEIADLRATRQTIELRQRPPQDVIAQINATLAEAGIASACFKSLVPEAESSAGSPGAGGARGQRLLRQTLRLVLDDLTPDQLGAWLLQWRSAQAIWVPTRLELNHTRAGGHDSNRYEATILLTALYLADGPPEDS